MPQIILQGKTVAYTIKTHHLAKRLSLSIKRDGRLVATVPKGFNRPQLIESFLRQKATWILKHQTEAQATGKRNIKFDHQDYLSNKEAARALVAEKIKQFNQIYKFSIGRISIRNQSSRWGSCSASHNLNFSYKLIFLPGYVADYIIVHELCHLKELNHSPRFWALVAKTIPNHQKIRTELRTHGQKLL
jgi:hypothetical protein